MVQENLYMPVKIPKMRWLVPDVVIITVFQIKIPRKFHCCVSEF